MKTRLKHVGAMRFAAIADSGHRVTMSAAEAAGGDHAGARPMEMVLMGLGGCSGIDVLLILKKSRLQINSFEIEINAERADAIPAVFTRIHLHYRVSGKNLAHKKVARAAALSMEKYCSVTRMLAPTVAITHSVEVVDKGADADEIMEISARDLNANIESTERKA